MQDWVLDGGHASNLVLERLFPSRLVIIPLAQNLVLVDIASFVWDALTP